MQNKDSFFSFRDILPHEWKINIRGHLKQPARDFLHSYLGDKLHVSFLETNKGWLHDSRFLARGIVSDLVFLWVEDHICLVNASYLNSVLYEMHNLSVDRLWYSWFQPSIFND